MPHVSAPGKMFLSGEWVILEPGNYGIVAAVNRRVHARVQQIGGENNILIKIDEFGINVHASFDGRNLVFVDLPDSAKEKLKFTKEAIETALQYVKEKTGSTKSFSVESWGEDTAIEVDGQMKKVGFGSSAAAVVAIIAAVLELHGIHPERNKEVIYKLAAAAHFYAQGKLGSAFDIAASTYGGVFVYRAPDLPWVMMQLKNKSVREVVESTWPLLHLEPLAIPQDFRLIVGWTKSSASTPEMIKKMGEFKTINREGYNSLIEQISEVVEMLIDAWKQKDREKIINLVRENRRLLGELSRASGVPIQTADLKKLADIADSFGAAGKLSGAGGGDCGIAICFDDRAADDIKAAWQDAGLWPLDVEIDSDGIRVER